MPVFGAEILIECLESVSKKQLIKGSKFRSMRRIGGSFKERGRALRLEIFPIPWARPATTLSHAMVSVQRIQSLGNCTLLKPLAVRGSF